MAKTKTIVRIEIEKLLSLDACGDWGGFLDMLRYVGLLRSNTPGFPNVVEYECHHDPARDIARWQSFGYEAEIVREH